MPNDTATLIRDLESTRDETLRFFDIPEPDMARTYGPGKWPVRFLLHHLADSETVLNERIRRVLSEPDTSVKVFEQEDWARGLDYARMPIELSRNIFASVRQGIIYLASRYYESHGHIAFVHSTMGPRTLREEFDKVASHNVHHLVHIRSALADAGESKS